MMSKKPLRVVVLMGGASSERDVSLATGRGVVKALVECGHEPLALDPATGKVLALEELERAAIEGAPPELVKSGDSLTVARSPELGEADVVFVALHGGMGEDGTLQAVLDLAGVPYTGSGHLACALAMDKHRAKMVFRDQGIPVPNGVLLSGDQVLDPHDVERLGGFPLVIKPNTEGSSVGASIVRKAGDLNDALRDAREFGDVLVETYIPGREITVAVLAGRALPVVEIELAEGFYDYRNKYTSGETDYQVPADLPEGVSRRTQELAEAAFAALGCGGVARVDFRLAPDNALYCLEVNTIPGMTSTSLVPMAAQADGISYEELVDTLVRNARSQ